MKTKTTFKRDFEMRYGVSPETKPELPAEVLEQMNREGYASLESQQQYWINKEAVSNNATHETREGLTHDYDWAAENWYRAIKAEAQRDELLEKSKAVLLWLSGDIMIRGGYSKLAKQLLTELQRAIDASNLNKSDSATADPKPKEDDLSRTEATCDWFDDKEEAYNDTWSLRDAGRNPDGSGLSYGERNV